MRLDAASPGWTVSSPETLLSVPTTTIVPYGAFFGTAADPNGFLLSWIDPRGIIEATHVSNSGVVANRFGTVLSSTSTRLMNATWAAYASTVSTAFNGQYYLVAWVRYIPDPNAIESSNTMASEVLAVRVSTSGELLDATPIVIAKLNATSVQIDVDAVLSDGDSFFIAWSRSPQGRFVTFSGSTPVVSPAIQFESSGGAPRFVAFDGSKYVVAYARYTGTQWDSSFYFKRFSSADAGTAVPVALSGFGLRKRIRSRSVLVGFEREGRITGGLLRPDVRAGRRLQELVQGHPDRQQFAAKICADPTSRGRHQLDSELPGW